MSIPVRKPVQSQDNTMSPDIVEDVERRMILYVSDQLDKMRGYLTIGSGSGDPSFYELNQALCNYQDANLALLAIHNQARIEYTKKKEQYDDWYAKRYIETRDKLNPRSLSAQKWYSQKEIEMSVRVEFAEEFKRYNWELIQAEHELNFMRRMLDSWASQQFILTQLSKNLITEVAGLNAEGALERAEQKSES